MENRPESVGERARARTEAARKEQAFSALLVARLAYLAVGFVMTALGLWGAIALWFLAAEATWIAFVILIPFAFAAMGFLGAFCVVR